MKHIIQTQNEELLYICRILLFWELNDRYVGFYYTADAIRLMIENPERIALITKNVYMETAQTYGTTWYAVERGIRSIIARTWVSNRECFRKSWKLPADKKPTPSEFIATLYVYCSEMIAN